MTLEAKNIAESSTKAGITEEHGCCPETVELVEGEVTELWPQVLRVWVCPRISLPKTRYPVRIQ